MRGSVQHVCYRLSGIFKRSKCRVPSKRSLAHLQVMHPLKRANARHSSGVGLADIALIV